MSSRTQSFPASGRILKWIGVGTLVFGVLPVVVIAAREIPGIIRELKIVRMGGKGGWKQAHPPMPRPARPRRSVGRP